MDWILAHWETLLGWAGFLLAAFKAYRSGTLNTFLAKRMEPLITNADKKAITASATAAGLEGLLGRVVTNAGLSKNKKKPGVAKKAMQTLLPLALAAACLTGCGRSAQEAVLRESFARYVDTGEAIVPLVVADTPGEKALLDAFVEQLAAGRALEGR